MKDEVLCCRVIERMNVFFGQGAMIEGVRIFAHTAERLCFVGNCWIVYESIDTHRIVKLREFHMSST